MPYKNDVKNKKNQEQLLDQDFYRPLNYKLNKTITTKRNDIPLDHSMSHFRNASKSRERLIRPARQMIVQDIIYKRHVARYICTAMQAD